MTSTATISEEYRLQVPEATGIAFAAGFYFSFRIFIPLVCVDVLGTQPSTGAGASLAFGFLLLVLVCFHSLGAARISFRSMLHLWTIRWALVFLIFSCVSLAWSGTVSLPTSFVYWCGMADDVAIVVVLLRAGSLTARADSLMKGFVLGACCIALVAWVMPVQPDLRLGDEEFLNANQIGNLCAFAIFLSQYLMRGRKGKWSIIILFLTVTLVRSLSKTTIVAFLLSESFLVIQDSSISRKTKVLLTSAAVLLILVFWGLFEAYYDIYTTAGNQAETLTGRTGIWIYVLNAAIERPWIGHGFDSMWKVIPPFGPDQFEARHAENELLQQFWAYGVAGIIMLVGIYGSLWRRIRSLSRGPTRVFFLAFLLFIAIRGLAEAEPFDLLLPLWMIILLGLLIESARKMKDGVEVLSPASENVIRL